MSTSINIIRQNGGIKAVAENKDGVSALVMYMPDSSLPSGMSTTNRIAKISTMDECEKIGIKSDGTDKYVQALYYHIKEAIRINPAIELYIGLFTPKGEGGVWDFAEIKQVVAFAGGEIRQAAVYAPDKAYSKADIDALQAIATVQEVDDKPLSIIYTPKVADIMAMESGIKAGNRNVSICIGQDADEDSLAYKISGNGTFVVGMAGIILGLISKAKVNESIAWVKKFATGMNAAGMVDGKTYKELTKTQRDGLEEKGVLYPKTYAGYSGVYMNDSYTQDEKTSDYNAIERMRTMDKAARGVREYLLPLVGSPVEIDSETGNIDTATIEMWKNEANRYLEQMEKDGELSGYKVDIDAKQNVLATSKIEVIIQNVPMGVARHIAIKMSYKESI